ncbi:MAG: hypothetical protein GXZ11_05730 [Tissierellia bacterium]|nr:hypothetical protein [Tissierellia bacterium]
MSLEYTVEKIKDWAIDRGIHIANSTAQINKLFEEGGEIAKAFNKHNINGIKDGIGDVVVVLVVLSLQLNIDFTDCVNLAYNEIKDRRGKMINGVFVKEGDL